MAFPRRVHRFALLWFALLAWARPGLAHNAFEGATIARLRPDALQLDVTLARTTAVAVTIPGSEIILLHPDNFAQVRPRLVQGAANLFSVKGSGGPLPVREIQAALNADGDVVFTLLYPRPPPGLLTLHASYLIRLGRDYAASVTFMTDGERRPLVKLLAADDPEFELAVPASRDTGPVKATVSGFGGFLWLGIEHILTGYDHLLFLCGLLVACRRLGSMIGIITCFTLAHSLTLALAALGLFALPGRIVEPLIAASIVFVGLENLVRKEEPKGRWALTFAFGLIHGFGFAGALREIGLGAASSTIALPLFAFNLGVEFGQLAVMAVLLPLLLWSRQRPAYGRVVQPAASVVVVCAGAFWLLQRTVFA